MRNSSQTVEHIHSNYVLKQHKESEHVSNVSKPGISLTWKDILHL